MREALQGMEKMIMGIKPFLPTILSVLLAMMFFVLLRCWGVRSGETDVDAYYHVSVADMGPSMFMGRSFPYLTMSVWEDKFSDKEMLYHVVLSGLRTWQGGLGFSQEAPFNFPTLFFAGCVLCVFAYAVVRLQLPQPWIYPLLLAGVSPAFTSRLLMLRPQVVGVMLVLAAAVFSSGTRRPRDLWPLFITGFVASWSYSNPHFILLPVMAFAVFLFPSDKRLAFLMPLAAAGGVLSGLLLHPQFPNTLLTWKIQCVDVMIQILRRDHAVFLGGEFGGVDGWWCRHNVLFIVLFVFNAAGCAIVWAANGFKGMSVTLKAFLLMTATTFAGTLVSSRAIEYACPLSALTAGLVLKDAGPSAGKVFRKFSLAFFCLMIAAGLARTGVLYFTCFKNGTYKAPLKFAAWIEKTGIPPGTVIANLCWSDFPALCYALPQYRYLMGIDPMFGYARNPDAVEKLEAFRTGRVRMPPRELAELVNAGFAYVSSEGWVLARDMHRHGYKLVYQDEDGYFFVLRTELLSGGESDQIPTPAPGSK